MNAPRSGSARRPSSRKGVAALSAITLALSGLSITSFNTVVPEAAAALSGGIRDKSGAVEQDAQKASDLPAGSCVVSGKAENGSQAGFSWYTSEPSASSPNKKAWGLSVSFDNSKDRTFADWAFTNSGLMGGYLDVAQIPATDAGQTFVDKVVTHKADEFLKIDGSGRQRNLNLVAELTDAEVKQFVEATAANPVRYAWQGNYKTDRTSGPFATQGSNASFTAIVNPWPSENIECNPITVSWKNQEKLVIRPGEVLEVGKINVPAITGGGTDDSMSRMVVEAYDAQGNFIGTSDTDASGGQQRLTIDADGTIKYTMPEYKGTKLSDQQGMRFSVLAKPRTVDQLQAAGENNNEFGDTQVFDSSNSLTRYSKPNVIANHQWSFDDTQFHDPKYNPDQQAIISGVEDNKPTKERQVVTFKEAGDKISNLVKKREDGGFDAEVKLDKKNVYSGWDVKMDPNTYEVTVTAPLNPAPGTFAQPRVIVTYSNGSRDIIPLLVTVDHNNTQVSELQSPGNTKGVPGQDIEAQLTVGKVIDDYGPFTPTSYEVVGGVPEGWTVTVDENGKVTAKSPKDAPNFSTITPKIRATYPDGTIDEVDVSFQVVNNVKVPDYTAVSGKPEEEVKLQPVMPPVGLGGSEDDEEPNRYTFEDGSTEYKVGDWTVTVDENTGELTSTIPKSALPGAQLTVPVKVYYPSGANPQIATGTISVIGDGSGEDNAFYRPQLTKAGEPVKSDITTLLDDPKKATYKLPPKNQWPKDWEFSIDESGTVTATPGENVPNGATVTIPVEVTYPDGSKASVPADFTVVDAYARANQPSYPTVTGDIGTTVTSKVDRTYLSDAAEPRFSLVTDPKDPDYIAPPRNLTWDQVKIDPVTGEITTPIGKNVLPGSSADIPVRVTYKDGSRDFTIATVVARGKHRQIYEPKYELKTTKPGVEKASPILDDTKVPERDLAEDKSKRFSAPDNVEGWTVKVDESGIVTATPPADAKAGDGIQVPVEVTYLDGSKETVFAPFKVIEEQKDVNEPYYSVEVTGPGKKIDRPIKPNNIPAGSKFAFGVDGDNPITETTVDGWEYKINPDTGEISVTPPAGAKPGDKHDNKITVTYPDGSVDDVPVSTIVKLTNNWEADPTYPEETVYPGETAKLPVKLEKPVDVNVAKENPYKLGEVPAGWTVSIDDNGQVTATAPADAKPGTQVTIPVTVTYEDDSTDTAKAVVNVVDVPTREVPFKVEYKYDDSIPAGTHKVETKGAPGEEKQNKDGSWERTKAPVNEVVVVGTKPAESAKDVKWTVPIPFPTEVRENPDLKPGETRVVQEGENGEKTYTAKFTAKGSEAQIAEEETTKEAKPRIIEYGPGLAPSELVTKTEKPIPFETKVVFDDTLEEGKQVVDQQGELGTEVVTSTQKIVDGKPSGDPVVTSERTKEPTEQIIRVGTKTTGTNTEAVKSEVPFGVKIEFDPTLPAGESKVTTKGEPGEKTVTITRDIVNSKPGDPQISEEITKQPVDQVIKVGTKPSEASEKVTWTAQVPFEVITRPNPELKPGEIKVVQKGVPGEKTYTADFTAKGDQATVIPEEKQTKDPVNEIIEYGPAAEDTTVVTKVEKPVPFETEIVFDNTLKEGEQKVDQQGELGTEVVTSTQKIVDGKPSGDPEVTTERTKEPVKQIIRVGTKSEGTHTSEYVKDVPFETEVIFDDTMEAGKQETVQEGQLGKDKVTTTLTIVNSEVTDTKTETQRVTEPVKKIIKVGTKGTPTSTKIEWTENTPFEVEVRVNPKLQPGETKVVQEGKPGEIKHIVDVEVDDKGNVTKGEPTKSTVSEPVKQIIEVGPAKDHESTLTDKHTEKTPYDTLIEYDPNLEVGKVVEDQAGQFGEKEITKTWQLKNGQPVGDPETSEEVIKDPQPRRLRVGTKCKCEGPSDEPSVPSEEPSETPTTDPTEPTDPTDPSEPTETP
ncbi:G5 domain-containing protein, partial [Corynebacterium sp. HMSC068G04]|uniref:G5 domain-containing protein n=1 Tax=Corynebacterium sp. HMSC068G04 TaxID=1739497 RepID=UPI000B224C55